MYDSLLEAHRRNRFLDLERATSDVSIQGDFEGSVTGTWVRLNENGTGAVRYKQKIYTAKVLGLMSIPAGSKVELSHANGVYYATF